LLFHIFNLASDFIFSFSSFCVQDAYFRLVCPHQTT
jgi:hypothetical protein